MFVFLCVLWFALLLSVNFFKHRKEKTEKIIVENPCHYSIHLPFIKVWGNQRLFISGSFSFIIYYDSMLTVRFQRLQSYELKCLFSVSLLVINLDLKNFKLT